MVEVDVVEEEVGRSGRGWVEGVEEEVGSTGWGRVEEILLPSPGSQARQPS